MRTIGIFLFTFLKFFTTVNVFSKVVLFFNALSIPFCIIGPSAIGSVKGIPNSIKSTPVSAIMFNNLVVTFMFGSPQTR